jgi:K+-sensing histidine kinase KdpD
MLASTVVGLSDIALQNTDDSLDETLSTLLTHTLRNGANLLRIINNIFDVLRIEGYRTIYGSLFFQEISLNVPIKTASDLMKEFYRVEIDQNIPDRLPAIQADEIRISQVILIIASVLTNNLQQSHLTLTANTDDHHITFTLTNNQYTLPEDIIADYHRLAAAPTLFACRRFDIVLDLLISHALVKIHGGAMALNNCPGVGAMATLTLPTVYKPIAYRSLAC